MRLRRRIVTAGVSVACGLALAACGQQLAAHVSAGDSVHAALTGVFKSPTTRLVITAQDLPGAAAMADGSFSVVITTSQAGGQASSVFVTQSLDVSILHESTNLIDLRSVGRSEYLRVDLKDIGDLVGQTSYSSAVKTLGALAARPGLGFLRDILAGKWVGVSSSTLKALSGQISRELPSSSSSISKLQKLGQNTKQMKQLSLTVSTSLADSIRTWLSIQQKSSNEYSLTLPVRSFASSILQKLVKPLTTYFKAMSVSQAQVLEATSKIPSGLRVHANLWISKGSVDKIQFMIPNSSASLLIGVSHPTSQVQAPADATMVTVSDLTTLFGMGMGAFPRGSKQLSSTGLAL